MHRRLQAPPRAGQRFDIDRESRLKPKETEMILAQIGSIMHLMLGTQRHARSGL
jgi:hypothetical protein